MKKSKQLHSLIHITPIFKEHCVDEKCLKFKFQIFRSRMISKSSSVKAAKLVMLTLLESFAGRNSYRQFVWVKKVELFTFENIWIWLDLPTKVFILNESIKTGKIRTNKRL